MCVLPFYERLKKESDYKQLKLTNSKFAIPKNHNKLHRTKTCMTISNTKSTIPTNHNELNHEIRDNLITTKKFKRKKWLQVYETESKKILVK